MVKSSGRNRIPGARSRLVPRLHEHPVGDERLTDCPSTDSRVSSNPFERIEHSAAMSFLVVMPCITEFRARRRSMCRESSSGRWLVTRRVPTPRELPLLVVSTKPTHGPPPTRFSSPALTALRTRGKGRIPGEIGLDWIGWAARELVGTWPPPPPFPPEPRIGHLESIQSTGARTRKGSCEAAPPPPSNALRPRPDPDTRCKFAPRIPGRRCGSPR